MRISKVYFNDSLRQRIGELSREVEYKKGDLIMLVAAFSKREVIRVLEGRVMATLYLENGGEFYGEFKKGDIMGISLVLSTEYEDDVAIDIEPLEDVKLQIAPIGKIIDNRELNSPEFWEGLARACADESLNFSRKYLNRSTLTNEGYFLQYLSENGMKVEFENTAVLADILNTKLRTLQRIIKKLREKKIIVKSKNSIWVNDKERFEALLEEHYIN